MTGMTVVGIKSAKDRIRRIEGRIENPRTGLERIGTYFRTQEAKQFRTQGTQFGGSPWAPLKPSYRKQKRKDGYTGRILVRTGNMRDSFIRKDHPEYIQRIEGHSVILGSSNNLAVFHQYGTHSHRTGKQILPARPITPNRVQLAAMSDDVKKIVANYLVGRPPKPQSDV